MTPLVIRTCSALAGLLRIANRDRSIEIYDTHAALIAFCYFLWGLSLLVPASSLCIHSTFPIFDDGGKRLSADYVLTRARLIQHDHPVFMDTKHNTIQRIKSFLDVQVFSSSRLHLKSEIARTNNRNRHWLLVYILDCTCGFRRPYRGSVTLQNCPVLNYPIEIQLTRSKYCIPPVLPSETADPAPHYGPNHPANPLQSTLLYQFRSQMSRRNSEGHSNQAGTSLKFSTVRTPLFNRQ